MLLNFFVFRSVVAQRFSERTLSGSRWAGARSVRVVLARSAYARSGFTARSCFRLPSGSRRRDFTAWDRVCGARSVHPLEFVYALVCVYEQIDTDQHYLSAHSAIYTKRGHIPHSILYMGVPAAC